MTGRMNPMARHIVSRVVIIAVLNALLSGLGQWCMSEGMTVLGWFCIVTALLSSVIALVVVTRLLYLLLLDKRARS